MMEQPDTFTHRIRVIKCSLPVCEDCGAQSKYDYHETTNFGDSARTLVMYSLNECPNGPHAFEA